MKRLPMPILLSLALAVSLLGGCAPTEGAPPRPTEPQEIATQPPEEPVQQSSAEAPEQESAATPLPGVEGDYRILEHRPGRGTFGGMLEFHNAVVILWMGGEGENSGLLEVVSTTSGETLHTRELQGTIYGMESTGELTTNYRVNLGDRILYYSTGSFGLEEEYAPPEAVLDRMWSGPGTGVSFDYHRGSDTLAWCGEDGIHAARGDGSEDRLVLPGSILPEMVAAAEWIEPFSVQPGGDPADAEMQRYELPAHDDNRLRYVAPLVMNGGLHIAATSWLETGPAGDSEPRPVGVSYVPLDTGEPVHFHGQLDPLAPPAKRFGGGTLIAQGTGILMRMNLQRLGIVQDFSPMDADWAETRTADYDTYLRVRRGENGAELYRYTTALPHKGSVILTAPADSLELLDADDRHVLCRVRAGDEAGTLVLVPYLRA